MGFYLRKSVRVGPFRLNLSKSGVGVSAGIPGFRVGTGPRGAYVHAGRGGLYYRSSLGTRPSSRLSPTAPAPAAPEMAATDLQEIHSGTVLAMHDATADQLLRDLNARHRRPRYWRWVVIAWVLLVFFILPFTQAPSWLFGLAFFGGLIGAPTTAVFDWKAKHTALIYELDAGMEAAFRTLCERFDAMATCSKVWHVDARATLTNSKYKAGATAAVTRTPVKLRYRSPPSVRTNISIPAIPAGKATIYLFPERALVYSPDGVGAIPYGVLKMEARAVNFVDEEAVPRDAKVVAHAWQYVNKQGGPDMRFRNNRQLPVLEYEEIRLSSDSGLNEQLYLSRTGLGDGLREAIAALGQIGLPARTG